ncbi:dual specificity protein phosphatase family protein (plasmid) [Paenibacillus urinalis]|uniref:Dual specificity protein phosphatase family protein n=1 Tax=Paenibacillus urinalis TaxID=521520 RepID=A0AAX3N6G9_9BACL|nr:MULTISPECIES: dual specificity protein phosphatase family protein [Paenibacillus]MCM3131051.1 dual specificity protein phosphatase family protein [Paenibacillus sp. MER 78]WDH85361.1 dual specificity protein phosphatase family protein [Paenibacillus urinalis]WDH95201.1 dual specificity protein phosphatase family protein [Paenibacillus urinalis]WDI05325.1 dual specificity protein phosphatase family protein [Paenibacillus urinalis]
MSYHELIKDKVYIGGADDIEQAVKEQGITDVFDLRDGSSGNLELRESTTRHHFPIVEDQDHQDESIKRAIHAVKKAVDEGKKVYFHCSGGRNRTGTVSTGLLLELGHEKDVDSAELTAKSKRPDINIKPEMRDALRRLYKTM